jgi:hypothetical protein
MPSARLRTAPRAHFGLRLNRAPDVVGASSRDTRLAAEATRLSLPALGSAASTGQRTPPNIAVDHSGGRGPRVRITELCAHERISGPFWVGWIV